MFALPATAGPYIASDSPRHPGGRCPKQPAGLSPTPRTSRMSRHTQIPADAGWIAQFVILAAFFVVYLALRGIGALIGRVTP